MKGDLALQFIKISFIILLGIYLITLIAFCYKSGKTLKTLLMFCFSGLAVFAVINLLSKFTGVDIAVNGWTISSSAVFGVPGVIGLLILRMII